MCKRFYFLLAFIVICILFCIVYLWVLPKALNRASSPQGTLEGVIVQRHGKSICPLPPEGFQKLDLVGTWVAGFGEETDTLILREDGYYKQVIDVPSYHYESDWKNWWTEDGVSGVPYLHLEGMHLCVSYHLPDCSFIGGGDTRWWDPCENQIVSMPEVGILIVIGIPK